MSFKEILKFIIISVAFFSCSLIPVHRSPSSAHSTCQQHLLRFFHADKKQKEYFLESTLGLEFEGLLPEHVSYHNVAHRISRLLKEKDNVSEIKVTPFGAGDSRLVTFIKEGNKYTYTIKSDLSLSFRGEKQGDRGIEITSPILRDDEDINFHLDVLHDLQKLGLRARPDQAGIHIHYGLPRTTTYEDLLVLYQAFYKMGNSIKKKFYVNKGRDYIHVDLLERVFREINRKIELSPNTSIFDDPISDISIRSLVRTIPRYGTFEARFFNSTLDREVNELSIDLFNRIMKAWANKNTKFMKYVKSHKEIDIIKMARLLDADLIRRRHAIRSLKDANIQQNQYFSFLNGDQIHRSPKLLAFEQELAQAKTDYDLLAYLQLKVSTNHLTKSQIMNMLNSPIIGEQSISFLSGYILTNSSFKKKDIQMLTRALMDKSDGSLLKEVDSLFIKQKSLSFEDFYNNIIISSLKSKSPIERDYITSGYFKAINDNNHLNYNKKFVDLITKTITPGPITKVQLSIYLIFSQPQSKQLANRMQKLFNKELSGEQRQSFLNHLDQIADKDHASYKSIIDVLFDKINVTDKKNFLADILSSLMRTKDNKAYLYLSKKYFNKYGDLDFLNDNLQHIFYRYYSTDEGLEDVLLFCGEIERTMKRLKHQTPQSQKVLNSIAGFKKEVSK